jgi:predicted ATPase
MVSIQQICKIFSSDSLKSYCLYYQVYKLNLAFNQIGQSIGTHRMVILYLDDLQWADASSLAVVEALLVEDIHLLFTGSYRYL